MDKEQPAIDVSKKYVRLIERRPDGFVEFEFAIGEPDLCAEMLLPADAYEAFCEANKVIQLEPRDESDESDESESSDWNWNLHQATHQRFR
ncbi:phenol hydroxylase subunit [Thauera sp. WH-1]|uniref:phenol hydroxylase subunit n=1 Tax=Thauera sp. WH-1 TaxID=3398230 RepID=UPI0039FD6B5D